jgi:DNA polymerase-3 subunit delta'
VSALFGHDEAIAAFLASVGGGRLHHAWLISGAEGIGKGLFARKAALRLLADAAGSPVVSAGLDVPAENPVARLIQAGSHPEYMELHRLPREGSGELARNITVAQVRSLQRLFNSKPAMSPWRAVVIDSVDDLERAAANALLKNLEEPPPNSIFLLVSHAPARLLPTIRSRCRHLRLSRLSDDVMTSALEALLPDAEPTEIKSLVAVGEGSPGRALAFRGLDIEALDTLLEEIATKGDRSNAKRSALAQSFASKAAQGRYEAFLTRAPSVIARKAKMRRGAALADALRLWERAHDLAGSALRLSLEPQSVVFELAGMLAALAPRQADG